MASSASRETLLARACVAGDDEFPDAFREFDTADNLDRLSPGEIRLIPYLFRRIERSGVTTPRYGIYKGTYTKFWYTHTLAQRSGLTDVSDAMGDTPFLTLKGFAFQHLLYAPDPVKRPIDDIDILVRPDHRFDAFEALKSAGFSPAHVFSAERVLALKLSINMVKDQHSLDLHWGLYPTDRGHLLTEDFFDRAIPLPGSTSEMMTLALSDHFLHTLLHAKANNVISPIRWVVDAKHLMDHPGFSWSDVVAKALEWGWGRPVYTQLTTLATKYGIDVDTIALSELQHSPQRLSYDAYHAIRGLPTSRLRGALSMVWANPMNLRQMSDTYENMLHAQMETIRRWSHHASRTTPQDK